MVAKRGGLPGRDGRPPNCRLFNRTLRAVEESDAWFVVKARRIENAVRRRRTVDVAAYFPSACIGRAV